MFKTPFLTLPTEIHTILLNSGLSAAVLAYVSWTTFLSGISPVTLSLKDQANSSNSFDLGSNFLFLAAVSISKNSKDSMFVFLTFAFIVTLIYYFLYPS